MSQINPQQIMATDGSADLGEQIRNLQAKGATSASASDLTTVQINLIKTNFKVSALMNASRYSMKNMIIDDFNDVLGVNTSSTTAAHDSTNKLFKNAGLNLRNLAGGTLSGNQYTTPQGDKAWFPNNPTVKMYDNSDGGGNYWHGGDSGSYTHTIQFAKPINIAQMRAIYERPYLMKMTVQVSSNSTDGTNGTWTNIGSVNYSNTAGILTVSNVSNASWMKVTFSNVDQAWTACSELQIWSPNPGYQDVISLPDTTSIAPSNILLSVDETLNTGSITYQISRDGGTNWVKAKPDIVTDMSSLPSGTQIVLKASIAGDATLTAWGYSWI